MHRINQTSISSVIVRIKYCIYVFVSSVYAEEFKIREKRYYGGESLKLQTVKTGGASIARIFELTEPSDDELNI
jgi:hypothetical protein